MGIKQYLKYILLLFFANMALVHAVDDNQLQELVKQCGMCHGLDGNSVAPANPSIAGMTRQYFIHTFDAYRNDGRHSDMMKMFVHNLNEEQTIALADYYAKQKFIPRDQEFDSEKAKQGKVLHDKYCEKCHENAGRITENNYGFLAGQWTPYLKKVMKDYLDKKRNAPPMMITKTQKMIEAHGEESIDLLMHYYASLK